MPSHALVRGISPAFASALTRHPGRPDPVVAMQQHAAYVHALRTLGLTVLELPADPLLPDCCFVEDTALIANGRALLSRPGAPSRRAEVEAIAAALPMPVQRMEAPATLDGGDCLMVGKRWYIGQSTRTNAAALEAVWAAFPGFEVVAVPVVDLHLKCSCSSLGEGAVLLAENTIPKEVFSGCRLVMVPEEEAYAANVVTVGRSVLLPAGFPATRRILEREGFSVVEVENSEIRKADGALTCMSLLWD